MDQVIKQSPEAKLLIVGSGEQERNLRQLTEKLLLTENVIFVGAVPNNDLPVYFSTADIFIGPSIKTQDGDTEGFGLTFVEAAMSGCIVVGTSVGGISDIIKDGETGFLVPEKSPQAIAEALIRILQNPSKINTMKNHAREKMIQQFDWQSIAERYAGILKDNTSP